MHAITFAFLSGWSFQTGQLKLVKFILNVEVKLALFLLVFAVFLVVLQCLPLPYKSNS